MPDIAVALKAEIARIARKEIRAANQDLKKASVQHRSHIAALRKRIESLERHMGRVGKAAANRELGSGESDASQVPRRFSVTRLATTRRKLGLSAADFGALIGVTGQSVYKWEAGESRPRAKQLEAIAAVRGIGKREAASRLQAIGASR
jgi:DNA-binding transcriptional regulator YiaG